MGFRELGDEQTERKRPGYLPCFHPLSDGLLVGGEDQGEGGTGARAIGVRDDVTSMGAGDPAGDGEPDSATTDARRIGPVETLEDSLQISGGEAPSKYR